MTFENEQTSVKSIIRVAVRRNLPIRLSVIQIPVIDVSTIVFSGVYFKCKTVKCKTAFSDDYTLFISCPTFKEAKNLQTYIRERKEMLDKVHAD